MTCPHCRQVMRTGREDGAPVYVCLTCNETVRILPPKPSRKQGKLPGLDPGRQEVNVAEAEKALCRRLKAELERRGYRVFLVGQLYANLGGNTDGAPDLFAGPVGSNRYRGLEVKLPGYSPSDVRPLQQLLADNGETTIVTCLEEALEALEG